MLLPYPEVLRLKSRGPNSRVRKPDGAAEAAPSSSLFLRADLLHDDLSGVQDHRLVSVHHRDGLPVDIDGEDLDLSPRSGDDDSHLLVRIRLAVDLERGERDAVVAGNAQDRDRVTAGREAAAAAAAVAAAAGRLAADADDLERVRLA